MRPGALLLGLAAASAAADEAVPVRVRVEAPAACPGAGGAFLEAVRGRTTRARPARDGEPARDFAVRVVEQGGGFLGTLRAAESEERAVEGRTCDEVMS